MGGGDGGDEGAGRVVVVSVEVELVQADMEAV